jgi:CheY-like chemotaxis protein
MGRTQGRIEAHLFPIVTFAELASRVPDLTLADVAAGTCDDVLNSSANIEERSAAPGISRKGTASPAPQPAPGEGEAAQARDVLLVEDDHVIREELAEILRFEGFTVITAVDGRDALERLARSPVRVIVLDLMLPVMSGWELAEVVRSSPDYSAIPILTITAVANAHRAPGGPVFLKPLNIDSLIRAIAIYARPQ